MATGNQVTGNDGPQRAMNLVNHEEREGEEGRDNEWEIRATFLAHRWPRSSEEGAAHSLRTRAPH